MNRLGSGSRCRTLRNVITAKGLLPRNTHGTIRYKPTTTLGRRLVYVDWDNGMSIAVPPYEIMGVAQKETIGQVKEYIKQAATGTTGKVLPHNGRTSPGKARQLAGPAQQVKVKQNKTSPQTQRKLDCLAHDFPELYARVYSGELSMHKASQMAGLVKTATPLEAIKRAWVKAKEEEREEVLQMVLEWKEHLEWKGQKVGETLAIPPGRTLSPHPGRLGVGDIGENGRDLSA
jgi:hypothetical protein